MTARRPAVTVVTLSFNQGEFLEQAMLSVLQQDYPTEYIVVDPGSTDGSRELIDRYRGRLSRVLLEPDDGPADGLNKAFGAATGDVLACLNADDALLPGAISGAVIMLERYANAAAVYGDGYVIDEHGSTIRRFGSTSFTLRRFAYRAAHVMHQATFVRRAPFFAVGGYNVQNRTCWDAELIVDLALAGHEIAHAEMLWGAFRLHPDSISGSGGRDDEYQRDRARLFAKIMGRPPAQRDRILCEAARIGKWLCHPRYVTWRLADYLR